MIHRLHNTAGSISSFYSEEKAVELLGLVNGVPDPASDKIVNLAADLLSSPNAAISIVEPTRQRQFLRSFTGFGSAPATARETPLSRSICARVRETDTILSIRDAVSDPVFSKHEAHSVDGIASYLGAPIHLPDGRPIGALCVFDNSPREWSQRDIDTLVQLAALVDDTIYRQAFRAEADTTREAARRVYRARNFYRLAINHEFRNALNGVAGLIEVLANLPLDRNVANIVEMLHASSDELVHLLQSMTRPERVLLLDRQASTERKAPHALDKIVSEAFSALRFADNSAFRNRSVVVKKADAPIAYVEAVRLKKLIYGLLVGMERFVPELHGCLDFALGTDGIYR